MTNLKAEPENLLLQKIKEGNYSAFDELYFRHFNTIYSIAYNLLRDHQQSKDIVQDIFVWFWEHRGDWELVSARGYLITAVKFKAANYFRENKVRNEFFARLPKQHFETADQSLEMEARQLDGFIRQLVSELPDRCREVFMMSRMEQLGNKEIAEKLQISEKTVEAHITLGLKKLRDKLGGKHFILFLFI